jgi:hypothetical protein
MLSSFELDRVSSSDLLMILVLLMIAGVLLGLMADLIMGRNGWGLLGNGLLIDAGMAGGVYALATHLWGLRVTDPLIMLAVVFAGATLALILGGFLKSMMSR